MQAEPSDTDNDCYQTTAQTNALLVKAFDFDDFSTGGFDVAEFVEKSQIAFIKGVEELDDCGYNKYLIAFDTFTNNIPQATAAGANLVTQVATGWSDSDTSIFISYNKMKDAVNNDWDIEGISASVQLGFSQLLKVDAQPIEINVTPTN